MRPGDHGRRRFEERDEPEVAVAGVAHGERAAEGLREPRRQVLIAIPHKEASVTFGASPGSRGPRAAPCAKPGIHSPMLGQPARARRSKARTSDRAGLKPHVSSKRASGSILGRSPSGIDGASSARNSSKPASRNASGSACRISRLDSPGSWGDLNVMAEDLASPGVHAPAEERRKLKPEKATCTGFATGATRCSPHGHERDSVSGSHGGRPASQVVPGHRSPRRRHGSGDARRAAGRRARPRRTASSRDGSAATRSCGSSAGAAWAPSTSRARRDLDRLVVVKVIARAATSRSSVERFQPRGAGGGPRSTPTTSSRSTRRAVERGIPFIAMEYVDGCSVADLAQAEGPPRAGPRRRGSSSAAAEGLAAAHEVGILHRDVKPANILVASDGRVKVADFGLAKLGGTTRAAPTRTLTASGMILGTPHYMAPEQAEGKELDARADIYALGVTYYELLTGRRPFDGETTMRTLSLLLSASTPSPRELVPDLPSLVERACLKLMARERAERPQSIDEALKLLGRISALSISGRAPRRSSRMPSLTAARAAAPRPPRPRQRRGPTVWPTRGSRRRFPGSS